MVQELDECCHDPSAASRKKARLSGRDDTQLEQDEELANEWRVAGWKPALQSDRRVFVFLG